MGTYTLSAPISGLSAPKNATGTREYFATHLRKKWKQYGRFFAPISVMTKVPIEILYGKAVWRTQCVKTGRFIFGRMERGKKSNQNL